MKTLSLCCVITLGMTFSAVGQNALHPTIQRIDPLDPLQRPESREAPESPHPETPVASRQPENAPFFETQRFQPGDEDTELVRLRKLKLQADAKLVSIQRQRFHAGQGNLKSVATALRRQFDSYLALEEPDPQQIEVFRVILTQLAEFDGVVQIGLQVGTSTAGDAAHLRSLRLETAIRMSQEIADDSHLGFLGLEWVTSQNHPGREAAPTLQIQRPNLSLSFEDRPNELATTLPAIMQPAPLAVEDLTTRLKKLRYNACALEMTDAQLRYQIGASSIESAWHACDRLVDAALANAPTAEDRIALREQHLLFVRYLERTFVRSSEMGLMGPGQLAQARFKLFDAALQLHSALKREGKRSELTLGELFEPTSNGDLPDLPNVGNYSHFLRIRPLPDDLKANLSDALKIARCNAATRNLVGTYNDLLGGGGDWFGMLLATEQTLRSALEIVTEPTERGQVLEEAVAFAQQIVKRAEAMNASGISGSDTVVAAQSLHLGMRIRKLE